jgi:hypothetical protein
MKQMSLEIELKMETNKDLYKKLSKVESICKEWFEKVGKGEEFISEAVKNVTITGATCLGVANKINNDNLAFDWVIIDEAGRATPPEILVPMILGKRVILVGDHKQLPPIVDKTLNDEQLKEMNIKKEELEESLFEYLGKKLPAAISIGRAKTFVGDHPLLFEAHILTTEHTHSTSSGQASTTEVNKNSKNKIPNLYGKWLAMDFISRIRPQHRFESVEALKAQIAKDVEQIKNILTTNEHGWTRMGVVFIRVCPCSSVVYCSSLC